MTDVFGQDSPMEKELRDLRAEVERLRKDREVDLCPWDCGLPRHPDVNLDHGCRAALKAEVARLRAELKWMSDARTSWQESSMKAQYERGQALKAKDALLAEVERLRAALRKAGLDLHNEQRQREQAEARLREAEALAEERGREVERLRAELDTARNAMTAFHAHHPGLSLGENISNLCSNLVAVADEREITEERAEQAEARLREVVKKVEQGSRAGVIAPGVKAILLAAVQPEPKRPSDEAFAALPEMLLAAAAQPEEQLSPEAAKVLREKAWDLYDSAQPEEKP